MKMKVRLHMKLLFIKCMGNLNVHLYLIMLTYMYILCCRSIYSLGQFVSTQVNLIFVFFVASKKTFFGTFNLFSSSSFSLSPLYLPHLLFPPCSPNIPAPILFINLGAYLVSLEPQTFGFPLDSCPDALPVSHGDQDARTFHYFY